MEEDNLEEDNLEEEEDNLEEGYVADLGGLMPLVRLYNHHQM